MPIKTVDVAKLKEWMEKGDALVVDVREPGEHAAERIEGTILIPLATVTKAAIGSYKGKKLVIHCGVGIRSAKACEKLLAEDPKLEVYHLEGGIAKWSASGYPTIKNLL